MVMKTSATIGTSVVLLGVLISVHHGRILCLSLDYSSRYFLSCRISSFHLRVAGPLVLAYIQHANMLLVP